MPSGGLRRRLQRARQQVKKEDWQRRHAHFRFKILFFKCFWCVPFGYLYFSLFSYEPGLGATGIDPGMTFTSFTSSIWLDSNPRPFDREASLPTTRPDIRPRFKILSNKTLTGFSEDEKFPFLCTEGCLQLLNGIGYVIRRLKFTCFSGTLTRRTSTSSTTAGR